VAVLAQGGPSLLTSKASAQLCCVCVLKHYSINLVQLRVRRRAHGARRPCVRQSTMTPMSTMSTMSTMSNCGCEARDKLTISNS